MIAHQNRASSVARHVCSVPFCINLVFTSGVGVKIV